MNQIKSFSSSVAGASVILVSLSILSKGFGFIREILYASTFGLNKEFDLYLVSSSIPIIINTAVIYIGQHYFVPQYHKLKKESLSDALSFFHSTFYIFILGGIVLSVLLALFSNQILEIFISQQSAEVRKLGVNLFLLYLVTIPLNAAVSILSSYMQSEFNFTLPAFSQLLVNFTIILMVIFLSSFINIFVLPVAFIVGNLTAFAVLYSRLFRGFNISNAFNFKFLKIDRADLLYILIFIELVSLSYPVIDRYFYSEVPEGGIAALNYALTVYSMPVSVFTIALITAIFPKFSQQANEDKNELVFSLKKGININIFITVPISVIFICNGFDIIKLFYQRGEFVAADTEITNIVLMYYSFSLIFYSSYLIIVKLLYSLSLHRWILVLSLMGFFIKFLLNFLVVNKFHQNGLALSTSAVFFILFILGFIIASKTLKQDLIIFSFKKIMFNIFNALLSYFSVIYIIKIIGMNDLLFFPLIVIFFVALYFINSKIIVSEDYLITIGFIKDHLPNVLIRILR